MLRANYENHKAKQRRSISSARDQVRPVRCSWGSCSQGDGQIALNSERLWSAWASAPVSSTHLIPLVSNLSLCLRSVVSLPGNNSLCLLMVNTCYGCPSYQPVVPHIEQVPHWTPFLTLPIPHGVEVGVAANTFPTGQRVIWGQISPNSILFLLCYIDAVSFYDSFVKTREIACIH